MAFIEPPSLPWMPTNSTRRSRDACGPSECCAGPCGSWTTGFGDAPSATVQSTAIGLTEATRSGQPRQPNQRLWNGGSANAWLLNACPRNKCPRNKCLWNASSWNGRFPRLLGKPTRRVWRSTATREPLPTCPLVPRNSEALPRAVLPRAVLSRAVVLRAVLSRPGHASTVRRTTA